MITKRLIGGGLSVFVSDVHRFGTDAVLLAHFAKPKKSDRVVEFGTGCGIISLLLSREMRELDITAIDIQQDAVCLLQMAIKEGNLSNITPVCADLTSLKGEQRANLVIMNPPYKKANGGIQSEVEAIKIARHEIKCDCLSICQSANRFLTFGGRLCMCQRPERLADLMGAMAKSGIEPKRLRLVQQSAGKPPMLFLLEGVKGASSGMVIEAPLLLDNQEEMNEIYALWREVKEEN